MKHNSASWLVAGLVAAGLLGAGASWWFRYEATHRAARFWGPETARSIRDASSVELLILQPALGEESGDLTVGPVKLRVFSSRDISAAPGLTHLRNALLEDRSYEWPARTIPAEAQWTFGLRFRDGSGPPQYALFSSDFHWTISADPARSFLAAVSCEPIADGLQEVFAEWSRDRGDER
jgi:hypothetical protein